MTAEALRIGCGAAFAGDRVDAAVDLARRGELDYLVLDCLAERTIALGQGRRLQDPSTGYEPRLEKFMRGLLPALRGRPTRLLSNFGSANPPAAGRRIQQLAQELGVAVDVAVVTGDSVLDRIDPLAPAWEDGEPLEAHGELISANAYLGADALMPALATGARVIVSGRVADPSLFLAPMVAEFGWDLGDWTRLAAGTVIGHLLECGSQVCGGYFADPPLKEVPDLARVGCPIAEVDPSGTGLITKLADTGGLIDRRTVLEQLTYEVVDPGAYLTPDVSADFTGVQITETGADRIEVRGGRGAARPAELKVSVGYRAGFRCEAQISYGGRNGVRRARLAADVLAERLSSHVGELRFDLLGISALHGPRLGADHEPYEVCLRVAGLRVAGTGATRDVVEDVGEEVFALGVNGPAGGGGFRTRTDEIIGILSTTIARESITPSIEYLAPVPVDARTDTVGVGARALG
jgi:hypothetical protein